MKNISPKLKIVIICGPTGVGKTRFAIDLALKFGGEIIGADSVQIYRHMDIGSAKPTAEERAAVPHHLVDCVDPDRAFSAADYAAMAQEVLQALYDRDVLPVVVGGTGLYIKALVYGLFEAPAADEALRRRLHREVQQAGAPALHRRLAQSDPQAAGRIHPNDAFRITRALEVLETTGRSISRHQQTHGFRQPQVDALSIGLTLPRDQLYERINHRIDLMLAAGLKEEVQSMLDQGYDPQLKSMQSLGYRHMTAFLQGAVTWDEAVVTLKRDHRRYAKRQMTWFSADGAVHWLQPDGIDAAIELVERFLKE
jgi:tRNA dimethylallyltransferase